MFLRILRLQACSKDSHFSKDQEANTSVASNLWTTAMLVCGSLLKCLQEKTTKEILLQWGLSLLTIVVPAPCWNSCPHPLPLLPSPQKLTERSAAPLIHIYIFWCKTKVKLCKTKVKLYNWRILEKIASSC